MVALEAWALGKPVLANGRCDVLRGQVIRSNGGLYYDSFEEFCRSVVHAGGRRPGRRDSRSQRARVLSTALRLAGDRTEVSRHARSASPRAGSRDNRPVARLVGATAAHACACASGGGCAARRTGGELMPRVHQIMATLGYGDAIGNEALGIQRALRAAGYDSEIIVETADPRLEDRTVDYRDIVDEIGPDDLLVHHFSLGSRASRTAFALPCRMILIYHNITPPEYFLGVHDQLVRQCYHGRRELLPYRSRVDLALGDSEFNRQELETLGFAPTAVLPVVPDFSHLDVTPDPRPVTAYDDDWTNVLFVGRVIPNKRFDNVIRFFHAYKTPSTHAAVFCSQGRMAASRPTWYSCTR